MSEISKYNHFYNCFDFSLVYDYLWVLISIKKNQETQIFSKVEKVEKQSPVRPPAVHECVHALSLL